MNDRAITANLRHDYPGFSLEVDLTLPDSGVTVLFGHSGSGKTTLLRCIAGLARAQRGTIAFQGDVWQDHGHFVPPHRRPIGYVFQEASLFPHLDARGNLAFALKRADRGGAVTTLDRVVELLGIGHLLERLPAQLSGGERQRVAIARALLINPRLLLMDEPLAALDLPRKLEILPYLERLKTELNLPILYVTHAPDEVARLADTLVAMADGRVLATGPLADTLSRLDFPIKLGEDTGVVVQARVTERDGHWHLMRVSFDGGSLWLRDSGHALGTWVRVRVLARDISLALQPHGDTSILNALEAQVVEIATGEHPSMALARLKVGNSYLVARLTHRSADHLGLRVGSTLWAQVKSAALVQ